MISVMMHNLQQQYATSRKFNGYVDSAERPGSFTVTATSVAGAVVMFNVTTVDVMDGSTTPSVTPASDSTFPLGTVTQCCNVTDATGNKATTSAKVIVSYVWFGRLQPIDLPNVQDISPSIFKTGSTVPVKFTLTDASTSITPAVAHWSYTRVGNTVAGAEVKPSSVISLFRHIACNGRFFDNWNNKCRTPQGLPVARGPER